MLETGFVSKFALKMAKEQFREGTIFINKDLSKFGIIQILSQEPLRLDEEGYFLTSGGCNFWSPELHQKSQELALKNRFLRGGEVPFFSYQEPGIYTLPLSDLQGNHVVFGLDLGCLRFIDPIESGFRVVGDGGILEEIPQLQGQIERVYVPKIRSVFTTRQRVLYLHLPLPPELMGKSFIPTGILIFDSQSGQQLEAELIQKNPCGFTPN